MIIARTPFRISFCGGGSDLPSFYRKHGGCVLSTTINKYMYISVHPSFDPDTTVLKYSKTEIIKDIDAIEHNYFRAVLKDLQMQGVEITSTADIPAGTGLGSSSSFTTGLFHALYSYKGKFASKECLARDACRTELDILQQPIGKQDQYAAAYGGLNFYTFRPDDQVIVEPILLSPKKQQQLETSLIMFYTGDVHSASKILKEQGQNVISGQKEENQLKMCELAQQLKNNFQKGNINALGDMLHKSWELKRTLASGISNPKIDEWYDLALKNGAVGGKLLGAGGGGFLLFYAPKKVHKQLCEALPLKEMPVKLDVQGSSIIYVG